MTSRSRYSARCAFGAFAAALSVAVAVHAQQPEPQRTGGPPPTLFSAPLADAPGKNLVVVELRFPPNAKAPSTPEQHPLGHRHPGSVYVYVTDGAVRLGVEGQPVQVVKAGGSFLRGRGRAPHHLRECERDRAGACHCCDDRSRRRSARDARRGEMTCVAIS